MKIIMTCCLILSFTSVFAERPIPVKPQFKNIVFRNLAQEANYKTAVFLTNPKVESDFNINFLSPKLQQSLIHLRNDILTNKENFNAENLKSFFNGLSVDTSSVDLETLLYWLVLQMAEDESKELRYLLETVKSNNVKKKEIREGLERTKNIISFCMRSKSCGFLSFAELDNDLKKLQDAKDSLSEQSEQDQLKMQMYMERMSKADSARSNTMKKFSEVSSQIIGNWK